VIFWDWTPYTVPLLAAALAQMNGTGVSIHL
jgi:hypothetical protein